MNKIRIKIKFLNKMLSVHDNKGLITKTSDVLNNL